MSTPLSILIPIYNVEPYLRGCLKSVTSQTLENIEIICINDGSTDRSLKIIKEFAKVDPRITIIDKKNSGYGASMNQALKEAHGEYIGIVEPDDWIEPEAFEKLLSIAKKYQADVVKANYYKFKSGQEDHHSVHPGKTAPVHQTIDEIIIETTKENTPEFCNLPLSAGEHPEVFKFAPAIWSAIYRKKFLEENDISFLETPGASYQDLGFSFKVWSTARTILLVPDAFYHYRIDNLSSSINSNNKVDCVVHEYEEIETFLVEHGLFQKFGSSMEAAKFRNYHWNFQRLDDNMAKIFYKTWREDLLDADHDHLLKRDEFSFKDWLAARAIIKYPNSAYHILRFRINLKNQHKHSTSNHKKGEQ